MNLARPDFSQAWESRRPNETDDACVQNVYKLLVCSWLWQIFKASLLVGSSTQADVFDLLPQEPGFESDCTYSVAKAGLKLVLSKCDMTVRQVVLA